MRLSEELKGAMLAYYLLPHKLYKLTVKVEHNILEEYKNDISMPETFGAEVSK